MHGQDHKHFGRLAVLLLALADLAERAGTRCLPVRCLVLWILRRAETVAVAYAVEATGSPSLLAACPRTGDTPDDAARLAKSLRALAAVFHSLAHWARLAQKSTASLSSVILFSRRPAGPRTIGALITGSFDTS